MISCLVDSRRRTLHLQEVKDFLCNVLLLDSSAFLLDFVRMNAKSRFPVSLLHCLASYQFS